MLNFPQFTYLFWCLSPGATGGLYNLTTKSFNKNSSSSIQTTKAQLIGVTHPLEQDPALHISSSLVTEYVTMD